MGNRAVITTEEKQIGVYVHWNGGRESVEAFVRYCKYKGYRCPEDDNYGWARLCQVVGNFFGGDCSVGIDLYDNLDTDNGDNGVYIIKGWEVVGRSKGYSVEERYDKNDVINILEAINGRMPKDEQLDSELWKDLR